MTDCTTCGTDSTGPLCGPCWQEQLFHLREQQQAATRAGWKAYRTGRPVIWVHGSPYEAPDDDVPDEAPQEAAESPFPWDLWEDAK